MTTPQLPPPTLRASTATLQAHPEIREAIIFGSRAKGTASDHSDIALAGPLTELQVETIREELEDLPFPLRFDLLPIDEHLRPPLREHIQRVGIPLLKPV